MAPKKAALAAAPVGNTTLTPGDTKMLAVICALMGDVAPVNYDQVAKIYGMKKGKSARQACRNLFEKIKAFHPELAAQLIDGNASGSGEKGSDNTSEENAVEATVAEVEAVAAPRSKRAKVADKPATKVTVGKNTAPKKAVAEKKVPVAKKAPAKKAPAKKAAAKAETNAEDAGEKLEEAKPMEKVVTGGKIPIAHVDDSLPSVSSSREATLAEDLIPELDQSVAETSSSSPAASTAGHSVTEKSLVIAAVETHESISEASDDVSMLNEHAATTSSADAEAAILAHKEEELTVATSVAVSALSYFASEQLSMTINGVDHSYDNQDIINAQIHGITLEYYILWKFENGIDRATVEGR
ncbi:uncharacterized protein RSE6_09705 [Rhynchosporium secalis]|uniref:Uncharacterized protein n=1 Tax=Rhynchosporium secalis TaxID=38038 RepID=A0A1E1MJN8_RHYSE|nr:uncharacterized protein RSE6_09705 [Rhynchosporium secalis]